MDMTQKGLHYEPEYKGAIEGYVTNYLKKNFWKVSSHQEYDDMMQESYIIFLRLKTKYQDMDTPQHFMALFKTSWHNHFTDFANKDSHLRETIIDHPDNDGTPMVNYVIGATNNDGMLKTLIRQAPEEVGIVIKLFLNAPTELLELASTAWKDSGHDPERGNGLLCKLCGFKEGTDVISMVKNYFTE